MSRAKGKNSTGGSRPIVHREAVNDWAVGYEPQPSVLALLRGIWGKRDLLDASDRAKVWGFLRWVEKKALTPAQLESAKRLGSSVGVGFDDPALDDPAPATSVQPWGPLPVRPPGR